MRPDRRLKIPTVGTSGLSAAWLFSRRHDHLLTMASAIWSAVPKVMPDFPAAAFIRFYDNHGLVQVHNRPTWKAVVGGSRSYVKRLCASFADRIRLNGLQAGLAIAKQLGGLRRPWQVPNESGRIVLSAKTAKPVVPERLA